MTRAITGTLLHPDGSPWAGGIVTFTNEIPFVTTTEVYPSESHAETLDARGRFSMQNALIHVYDIFRIILSSWAVLEAF
jgi:hypothetical protein